MALVNTINFLPEIFRSPTNSRFLGATIDQLTSDSVNIPLNGYVGRKFSPTFKVGDNYIPETNAQRKNYQLEPSVVVSDKNKEVLFNAGYIDLINSIGNNNGFSNNHQRLFAGTYYNYDGHFDYDKFVNYYDYYWLPNGPSPITITAAEVPYTAEYDVSRNTALGGYVFSGLGTHPNLPITVARGGTYKFNINQPGVKFWIQFEPGANGLDPNVSTIDTRQVYGVKNNGTDSGTIMFNVPLKNAQDFYTTMPLVASVDAAIDNFSYTDIQNQLLSDFIKKYPTILDGVNNQLQDKTFIFINNNIDASFWTTPTVVGPYASLDTASIRPDTVIDHATQVSAWKINLVPTGDGDYIIQINPNTAVVKQQRIFVTSGKTYASNQFWLNNNLRYEIVPSITATKDYLYYQDANNPDFVGTIKIVDNESSTIDITKDINGKPSYTSPGTTANSKGITFTNGLKVKFDTDVTPSYYAGNEYYVEGVGTSIALVPANQLEVPEAFGADIGTTADYVTINRSSADMNPWSRSNRWFHTDVIKKTALYNNTAEDYGLNISGRRPIIEFEGNLQLFNYGKHAGKLITYITFDATDAFVYIEGQRTYSIDGNQLKNGDRIVFANDHDSTIINEIWEVKIQVINSTNYITLNKTTDDPVLPGQNFLVSSGSHAGKTYYFNGSWMTNGVPNLCQVKTSANQPPLFDLVDKNGYSFADTTVYPGSSFIGTYFFGYNGYGNLTSLNDPLLGFTLEYQNFNNIGDIQFINYYDVDMFRYIDNFTTVDVDCNTGYLAKNTDLTNYVKLNNWTNSIEPAQQFQVFTSFYNGIILPIDGVEKAFVQIDILPKTQATVPHIKVYLNNQLLTGPGTAVDPMDYQLTQIGIYHIVVLTKLPNLGDKIDVKILSDDVSSTGYYEIPTNLDYNPLNENFNYISLGQVRTHYNKLIENTSSSSDGNVPTQDINLKKQGGTLIQHQSPAIYAMAFLNDPAVNFINGLNLAKKEYARFKNKFLSLCSSLSTLDYNNPASSVDTILQTINAVKNNSFPWYYSDMVPQGQNYNTITYHIINARQTQYEISSLFDITTLSNRAVIVYLNNVQLTLNLDYTFSSISPAINFILALSVGDVITIREYSNTDGNYIPETPTKLGLYPKFYPVIYEDNTYQTPVTVIQGHDGSITPAFGDFRDQFLLELELRIYNNIKSDYTRTQIDLAECIPRRFNTIDYLDSEFNQILAQSFLSWTGANNLDYSSNTTYDANNPWTWNYGSFPDIVDGTMLQGFWRSVYDYWYGTDTPNLTPWKMVGFSSKPDWWEKRYGPAPYTSGNTLLWEDLEAGFRYNLNVYDSKYARPGLAHGIFDSNGVLVTPPFVPVDNAGNLLDPSKIPLFKKSDNISGSDNFIFGQQGPVETAWRRSSDYPYAIQLAVALTKPAKYFATQLDTSQFYTNPVTGQFTNLDNQKITTSILSVNGATVNNKIQRTSGYINWIIDSIKNLGKDPVTILENYFKNFSVQLNYKVGGFTDQRMLTVTAEQSTPGSTSSSVIIPDINYKVYLNKSIPVSTAVYSAVIVEKTPGGYSVSGYDTTHPFFTIIPSVINSRTTPVTLNGTTVTLYNESTGVKTVIPYGTEFITINQVADFLHSYERYLVAQGFVFTQFNTDLSIQQDWTLSIQELIYWSQQGWATGTIIVLNPVSTELTLQTSGTVVDEITNTGNGNTILNQNFEPLKNNVFNIVRTDRPSRLPGASNNKFTISTLNGSTIAYARLNLVQFEHVIIFDNVDNFGDIIYIPSQGTRQYRLGITGYKTGGWSGSISAPGYIYSNPVIANWIPGKDYKLGDIILNNNFYYTATTDIPASSKFNNVSWSRINKNNIQTGLLPSFGLNAQEFNNFYDVDQPPTDETFQLYSAGLIGFRQRQYLTDLKISIPTQTKFYQGYIKQKGSMNAITALTKANFNNVNGNINVYEEWAFKVGTYGGVNSNQFKEFVLDQSIFTTSPVTFTLSNVYSTANTVVELTSSNLYNSSNLSSTTTSIYSDRVDTVYMTDFPSVGYMNLNDVDHTQYDLSNPNLDITSVGGGNKIWVAKDLNQDWQIYRVNETTVIATTLSYTLDNYASLKFTSAHNFNKNDSLILKYFNSTFDGIYTVINAPNPTSVTIKISNIIPKSNGINAVSPLQKLIRATTVTGLGTVYKLESARYATINDLSTSIIPAGGWINNDHAWIDSVNDGWGVYTFAYPWTSTNGHRVTANTAIANSKFGSVTRISTNTNYVYVGNPGTNQVQVFANTNGSYSANITVSNINAGFGSEIATVGNLVAIAAPTGGNVHVYLHSTSTGLTEKQLLVSPNVGGLFGTSISISADQHYMYVGEPGTNKVQAYWTANLGANVSYIRIGTIGTGTGGVGSIVKTNTDGSLVFVSAPTANAVVDSGNVSQNGNVYVYTRTANSFSLLNTITSKFTNQNAGFGTGLAIDSTAGNLYISAPRSTIDGYANGLVERWVFDGTNYIHNANILHPFNEGGSFGSSIGVSNDGNVLAVGSLGSASLEHTSFDTGLLVVDTNTTRFVDHIASTGAVYLFEPLGKYYTYIQELESQLQAGDAFGSSIDVTSGLIAVGAPSHSIKDTQGATITVSSGQAYIFVNPTKTKAWNQTRSQQPVVDIDSVSRTFIYNKSNNKLLASMDYFDPAKGKVLHAVDRDIDFKLSADPAQYNAGKNNKETDMHWGPAQVGTVWWNLDTVRYINYEQDTLIYRLNNWGSRFPGSTVDIYQWIESAVPPSQYTGDGRPLDTDDSKYCTYGYINPANGTVNIKYYFWVTQISSVAPGKNNSIYNIAESIVNPESQGITYAIILRNDAVALYNVNNLLMGQNSILQLGSTLSTLNKNPTLIHSEYALVQEGNPASQIPTQILTKIIDSMSGIDQIGNDVPDPSLPLGQAYGINIRPRQTMIMNKPLAMENYLSIVNPLLKSYPVVERKVLTILNSQEPIPGPFTGAYDLVVNTHEELGYINTTKLAGGYKVLVKSDINNLNKWAIYTLGGRPGISATWTILAGTMTLQATGLPYHSYSIPNPTNVPIEQTYNTIFSLRGGTNNPAAVSVPVGSGPIGYWLNGVAVYSPSAQSIGPNGTNPFSANWHYNASPTAAASLGYSVGADTAGGTTSNTGQYNYRDFSFANAWLRGTGAVTGSITSTGKSEVSEIPYYNGTLTHTNGHSKILGYALDGYPIYGPYGYNDPTSSSLGVRRMTSGYTLKTIRTAINGVLPSVLTYPLGTFIEDYVYTGAADLDQHNGRYGLTPDYPNGTYAYFVSVNAALTPVYPYVIGNTYYGYPATTTGAGGFGPVVYGTNSNVISSEDQSVHVGSVGGTFGTAASRIQSYKTPNYWSYIDWYDSSYNESSAPDVTVANALEFGKLVLRPNTYVKVLNNGSGQFIVYYIDNNLQSTLVGIQNGTIEITGPFDNTNKQELRQILLAMQKNIFVEDIAAEYNNIFFTMIKYILTEQKSIDWAFKTSFIGATQDIRKLKELPAYVPDNQTFYLNYIEEVKPYRTHIREFIVNYVGNDVYGSDITDFDLPPYYDRQLEVYRSPTGEQSYDANLLSISNGLYSQWYNNYTYEVVNVVVANAGTGFLYPPLITIDPPLFSNGMVNSSGITATAYATLNGRGGIEEIIITNPGSKYTSQPTVILNGAGTGATAYAVLRNIFTGDNAGHNLVRSISTTMKFDRTTYSNTENFVFWDNITASANIGNVIQANTVVVLNSLLYKLSNSYTITGNVLTNTVNFPSNVEQINSSYFNNAVDRIISAEGNINLSSVIGPVAITIDGNTYLNNTVDTVISSQYTDTLGINPSDIIASGGEYVGLRGSPAPEELVPGIMFDNLNMAVYDTNHLAFRSLTNMNSLSSYYRIASANSTTLQSDLLLSDNTIYVNSAITLPPANPTLGIPGVIFINGEKITYYVNYAWQTVTPWTANADVISIPIGSLVSYGTPANIVLTTGNIQSNVYVTTGNVYGSYFANVTSNVSLIDVNSLTQIRRAVDGTGPGTSSTVTVTHCSIVGTALTLATTSALTGPFVPGMILNGAGVAPGTYIVSRAGTSNNWKVNIDQNISDITIIGILNSNRHPANSAVVDSSIQQQIPKTAMLTNTLTSNVTYPVTGLLSLGLNLTGNITVNIGDTLTQIDSNTGLTSVTMRVLETKTNSKYIPVIVTGGTLQGLPELFDGTLGFDEAGFADTVSTLYITPYTLDNSGTRVGTSTYVLNTDILGNQRGKGNLNTQNLNPSGTITVYSGTEIQTGKLWYNSGYGQPSTGTGLVNSTTDQVTFLKARPGYSP